MWDRNGFQKRYQTVPNLSLSRKSLFVTRLDDVCCDYHKIAVIRCYAHCTRWLLLIAWLKQLLLRYCIAIEIVVI